MNKPLTSSTLALAIVIAGAGWAAAQDDFELTPLDGVIVDMQVAGGRLGRFLTDKPTQRKQQDAIDKLDSLIKLLEQRRRRQGGQASANPDEPLQDSIIKAGPGGSGPLHAADRQGRDWGQLPAHKREEILQSMTEGFPPHYQRLLARYYRRLAEERPSEESPVAEGGEAPAAVDAPAPEPVDTGQEKPPAE